MVFGHKGKLQIELGDLTEQQQRLLEFLRSSLNADVTLTWGKLTVTSETVQPQDLRRLVTKFIYKRNLNSTHYALLNGSTQSRLAGLGKKRNTRNAIRTRYRQNLRTDFRNKIIRLF